MRLREVPEPLDVDAVAVVTGGTVLWGIAGILLALFGREWLAENAQSNWLGVCAAGFGLGVFGSIYCRRRRSRLGRAAAARAE